MADGTGNSNRSPNAPEQTYLSDTDLWLYRIPGRDASRGQVTHKRLIDMNRKERRAMQTPAGRRMTKWPPKAIA